MKNLSSSSSKLESTTHGLLEILNKLIYVYHNNSFRYDDYEKKLNVVTGIVSVIADLLKKKVISDDNETTNSLKLIYTTGIQGQQFLQIHAVLQPIEEAINDNNQDKARKLLKSSFVIKNQKSIATSLLYTYSGGYTKENSSLLAIKLICELEINFNIDECNSGYDRSALERGICGNAQISILAALIDAGADVNQCGGAPLQEAAYKNNIETIKFLLQRGANPKLCNRTLNSIVSPINEYFVEDPEKTLEIIKLLVEKGMPIDTENDRASCALKMAILVGHMKTVKLLLDLRAPVYENIMIDAIDSNNTELVIFLLEYLQKFNITFSKEIPHYKFISLEMFQYCLKMGMSLMKYSLADKVVLQTPQAVKYCLDRGDSVDRQLEVDPLGFENNCSLAHFAAGYATRESLAMLISKGLDINARNSHGVTPMHYAVAYPNPDAVKILILAGADINALDSIGTTPLHWAVRHDMALSIENILAAKILLYAGADPNINDATGKKPLECLECLYEGDLELKEWAMLWDCAFKLKPRSNASHSLQSGSHTPSSLLQITACFVANSDQYTRNLAYRNAIPEEVAEVVEEAAVRQLTPN